MGKINCYRCSKKCKGDVLKVGEKYFHKDCFTCKVCHKKMENTGFFCKDNSFYCLEDYKRHHASICFSCNEKIIGEVVTALNHTFHKECFKCSNCQKCFSPGDRVSMRGTEFLCTICCGPSAGSKEVFSNGPSSNANKSMVNGHNHASAPTTPLKDLQSSSIPIRRKNNPPSNDRPLSHVPTPQIRAPSNGKLRDVSVLDNNQDNISTLKHFHLPPGNDRSWLYTAPIVGSKDHPLALSTNNINGSLSNSSQKVYKDDCDQKPEVQRIASFPAGDIGDGIMELPGNRNHRPFPDQHVTAMSEKNRRKAQNPTVEALSAGAIPRIRKPRSSSQKTDRKGTSSQSPTLNRMRLSEVIKRSTTDCSSLPRVGDNQTKENDIPRDIVSASRSPSAVCEPLVPPRYGDHTETSPSRNDDYFRSSNRHLGYSMEFINSTNRSFISENSTPGYRRSLRNSNTELYVDSDSAKSGLRKTRVNSNVLEYNPTKISSKHMRSDPMDRGSQSLTRKRTIPYDQLRVSTLKMIRSIDKSNLEAYLSEEEFMRLFHLTRPGFYQLPEWKRNDLKKRVDLF